MISQCPASGIAIPQVSIFLEITYYVVVQIHAVAPSWSSTVRFHFFIDISLRDGDRYYLRSRSISEISLIRLVLVAYPTVLPVFPHDVFAFDVLCHICAHSRDHTTTVRFPVFTPFTV